MAARTTSTVTESETLAPESVTLLHAEGKGREGKRCALWTRRARGFAPFETNNAGSAVEMINIDATRFIK